VRALRCLIGIGIGAALAAACSDSDGPAGPETPEVRTLTVDASQGWVFVAFDGDAAEVVEVSDPKTSTDWDMAFQATSVMLNGGAAGPGGVTGYCVCQNADATDAEIVAMTPASELADFEAVTASDIPSDESAWESDALAPAIDGWYRYDFATHTVSAAAENVWMLRTASGSAYAKFHVTAIEGATKENAGRVTVEFAVQPSAGAPFGPTQELVVDVSSGPAYLDLETASLVTADAEWDLWFEGWTIRVNGGVSGSGKAGAVLSGMTFDEVTDASGMGALYKGDAFGGVFVAHPWYRYNLQGNHQIWPTYDVYLIRRGDSVYKVQLIGYYGPAGEPRRVTFRYARVR
jgi:hypothetical protein